MKKMKKMKKTNKNNMMMNAVKKKVMKTSLKAMILPVKKLLRSLGMTPKKMNLILQITILMTIKTMILRKPLTHPMKVMMENQRYKEPVQDLSPACF